MKKTITTALLAIACFACHAQADSTKTVSDTVKKEAPKAPPTAYYFAFSTDQATKIFNELNASTANHLETTESLTNFSNQFNHQDMVIKYILDNNLTKQIKEQLDSVGNDLKNLKDNISDTQKTLTKTPPKKKK